MISLCEQILLLHRHWWSINHTAALLGKLFLSNEIHTERQTEDGELL